jgi:heat shock protein HslJ
LISEFPKDLPIAGAMTVAEGLQMRVVMSNSRVLVCILAASLSVGCAESLSTPTSPSSGGGSLSLTAGQLSGTWKLASLQPAGQAEQATPSGATYTLTFDNGRLSTRADCNVCNGAFELSGQTLTVGPALACTRAACSTMAFEGTYTKMLSGESTIALSDGVLVLSSTRGVLRFVQ